MTARLKKNKTQGIVIRHIKWHLNTCFSVWRRRWQNDIVHVRRTWQMWQERDIYRTKWHFWQKMADEWLYGCCVCPLCHDLRRTGDVYNGETRLKTCFLTYARVAHTYHGNSRHIDFWYEHLSRNRAWGPTKTVVSEQLVGCTTDKHACIRQLWQRKKRKAEHVDDNQDTCRALPTVTKKDGSDCWLASFLQKRTVLIAG